MEDCPDIDLDRFFRPRGVAVIGASSDPEKLGHKVVANIIKGGFKGGIYPINKKGKSVCGSGSFTSLSEVEGPIDLALISIPAPQVKDSLRECGEAGIPFVIVLSAGFREIGNEELEKGIVDIVKEYGMRMLGPNVFGMIYTPSSLNAQFGPSDVRGGKVAIITQSGALGAALMGKVFEEGIGVSGVVSTGNKADISDEELLSFFCSDPNTDAILMYIEGLKDGRKFMEHASSISREKPIVVLKSGRSPEGRKAVMSHTASLSGSDRAFDGAFLQTGVLRARSLRDAISWTRSLIDLPLPEKEEVLVITNGGGFGVLAVDELEKHNIPLFGDMEWIRESMGPILPDYATLSNPVDMTAQAPYGVYLESLKRALREERIGAVIGIYAPTSGVDIGSFTRELVGTVGKPKKPIVLCTIGGKESVKQIEELNQAGIPSFYYPEDAVASLAVLYRHRRWVKRDRQEVWKSVEWDTDAINAMMARSPGKGFMSPADSLAVLKQGPVDVADNALVTDVASGLKEGRRIGFPLVVKTGRQDAVHKTESGGVVTDIGNPEELEEALQYMINRDGIALLMRQIEGAEVIIGGIRDPVFGPTVMFGMGGIFVEALNDVSFRVAPINNMDAVDMIESVKGSHILKGHRGKGPADENSLIDVIRAVGDLILKVDKIKEIEINPLITGPEGSKAVDCRLRIE